MKLIQSENTEVEVNLAAPAHPDIVELQRGSAEYIAGLGARLELRFSES